MDTTEQKAKRPRGKTLSKAPKSELVLSQVRARNLVAERFGSAIQGRGNYDVEFDCGKVSVPRIGRDEDGSLTYRVTLTGYQIDENSKRIKSKKSFSITVELEGEFKVIGKELESLDEAAPFVPTLVNQMHALAVNRAMSLASEIGFPGVRPDHGLAPSQLQTEQIA